MKHCGLLLGKIDKLVTARSRNTTKDVLDGLSQCWTRNKKETGNCGRNDKFEQIYTHTPCCIEKYTAYWLELWGSSRSSPLRLVEASCQLS